MNPLLLALTGLTLLVLTASAGLPELLGHPQPRARTLPASSRGPSLLVVRSASGDWYLGGQPISATRLARQLGAVVGSSGTVVRFLPSAALPTGRVSQSLAWLRRQGPSTVLVELPATAP